MDKKHLKSIQRTFSATSRRRKVRKIVSILDNFKALPELTVLDVGTGAGLIAHELANFCKHLISIDVRDTRVTMDNYEFLMVGDEQLPFSDESFDLVISNHTIEHLSEPKLHLEEIFRVLRNDGLCYLATPNKYWIIETHYGLPCLSILPRRIANAYMSAFNKGEEYDIYPKSFSDLKKLTKKFSMHNISPLILKDPDKYRLDIYKPLHLFLRMIPLRVIKMLNFIYPAYILILEKAKNRKLMI